jgi:hypothetical protein
MDAEVTEAIGTAPYPRTEKRVTARNGFREGESDTRGGHDRAGDFPNFARDVFPVAAGAASARTTSTSASNHTVKPPARTAKGSSTWSTAQSSHLIRGVARR